MGSKYKKNPDKAPTAKDTKAVKDLAKPLPGTKPPLYPLSETPADLPGSKGTTGR